MASGNLKHLPNNFCGEVKLHDSVVWHSFHHPNAVVALFQSVVVAVALPPIKPNPDSTKIFLLICDKEISGSSAAYE